MPRVPSTGAMSFSSAFTTLDTTGGGEAYYCGQNNNQTALTVWPTANRAILIPLLLNDLTTFSKISWENGATVSGNVDVGVYDKGLAKVVTAGSTVQAGTSVLQTATVASTTLAPDFYWLAMVLDNIVGTVRNAAVANTFHRPFGIQQMSAAFVLPAVITLTNTSSSYLPLVMIGAGEFS